MYIIMVIESFSDKLTENLFHGKNSASLRRIPPDLIRIAQRKLDMISSAQCVNDLRMPPGNHLEAMQGDFLGHYSIRVNAQYRIIFKWTNNRACAVRFLDYHY